MRGPPFGEAVPSKAAPRNKKKLSASEWEPPIQDLDLRNPSKGCTEGDPILQKLWGGVWEAVGGRGESILSALLMHSGWELWEIGHGSYSDLLVHAASRRLCYSECDGSGVEALILTRSFQWDLGFGFVRELAEGCD